MQVAKLSALLHICHHFWRTVAAFVLALVFIQAFAVACGGISTPTTSRPPVTQTPGIGVPVKGGNWQITIVTASRTTTWETLGGTYNAKSGNVLLVLDVTFKNLSSSQKTIISITDAMVISQDGKMFTPDAFEIKNSDIDNFFGTPIASGTFKGFSCVNKLCVYRTKMGVSGNSMSITLVYVLDARPGSSTNLKFQFQQVPPIPFSAT